MSELSKDEYMALKTGGTNQEDIKEKHQEDERLRLVKNIQTKDFLLSRTKETIKVPIVSSEGVIEVEIRARLTIPENVEHKEFLEKFKQASIDPKFNFGNEDPCVAKFMAAITIDSELNEELWSQVDDMTISEILIAYFAEPVRRMADAQKFRTRG